MPDQKHSATTPPPEDHRWIIAQNFLTLAILLLAPLFRSGTFNPLRIALGAILILLGAAVGITGVRALGANRTPHPTPRPDSKLVQHGVYSIIRHPLYSSLILITFGWSILFSSIPALICSASLTLLLDRKARLEERYLLHLFPEYHSYAARVRRFIPGLY